MFNWFKKKKPAGSVPAIVELLDNHLANTAAHAGEENLCVAMIRIPLHLHFLGTERQLQHCLKQLPISSGYIPRSIAYVAHGGDWYLFVGYRSWQEFPLGETTAVLYMNALNATNQIRSQQ